MKKITYACLGALLILAATIIQRVAGGGTDLMLLVALGLVLLVASADVPTKAEREMKRGH